MPLRVVHVVPLLSVLALAPACSQSDFGGFPTPDELPPNIEGPGHPAWGSADISCEDNGDCAPNESCEGNVCMPKRCTDGPYESSAPLGPTYLFFREQELIAADDALSGGAHWIDGYQPDGNSLPYMSGSSFQLSSATIIDVAGGNVLGTRPDAGVAALAGSASIRVLHPTGSFDLDIEFQPQAVAVGDIDQDSIDEVVALGASGQYAICHADERRCDNGTIPGAAEGFDVTMGDIDGDNDAEPVFLIEKTGGHHIVAFNVNHEDTGEAPWLGGSSDGYLAISAGIVDGSNVAKVVGLRDGGYLGWASDKLDTLEIAGANIEKLGSASVSKDARDLELADIDMDGRAEIALLYGDNSVQIRRPVSAANHDVLVDRTLENTSSPRRIALADLDGDSPIARQMSGPEPVPGNIVPVMVMQFPPYSSTFSEGDGYLFIGQTENLSEEFTDSMAVRFGVGLGFETKIAGAVGVSFMGRFGQEFSKSRTLGTRYTIGARFAVHPYVDRYGNDFSAVMLSSGCFHEYRYQIDDPGGALDSSLDGSVMGVMIPVGGNTTVWSSKRYNALAKHLGNLPIVETRVRIGNPDSYPEVPETTEGLPVPEEDKVFPYVPNLDVSDIAVIGYWLAAAETESNSSSRSIDLSGYGSFSGGIGPVSGSINYDFGLNQGSSHSVTMGAEAIFGGGVPAIIDDPVTPEDELATHGFSFSPMVHREYYTDVNGKRAGYYVLSFTVGR